MAKIKRAYRATLVSNNLAAQAFYLMMPDGSNVMGLNSAAVSGQTTPNALAAALALAINNKAATYQNRPVKAASSGADLYVVMVIDSADATQFKFNNNGNIDGLDTNGAWTNIDLENPYVDPTAGLYTGSQLVASLAAVGAIAAAIR